MRKLSFILFCLTVGLRANAQLVVNPNVTGEELVDLIVQDGIVVTNVLRTCPDGASASFDGTASNIGIPTGALFSTGLATAAIGPNNSTGAGGACFGAPGDPDVEAISGGSTFDACILEFDIVPTCADIGMTFVFGSEEYPENINSEFKDAMVITISGPGFVGNQNIALVPGTTAPISVGTVNQNNNNSFYNNNNGGQSIQYDGFTTPITASVTVTPCQTYRIKIAVADGADCVFDSGVFVQENSMDCGVDIAIVTQYTAGNQMPIKGCRDYDIEFCRQGSTANPYSMNVTFAGEAVNGSDFELLPNAVTFAAGEQCQTMTIVPLAEGLFQGAKELLVIYDAISGNCTVQDTINVTILDEQGLIPDFYFNDVCLGSTVFFNNATTINPPAAATAFYWRLGDGTETDAYNTSRLYDNPGTYDVWLIASSTDGCTDSVMQQVTVYAYPEASFTLGGDICLGVLAEFTNTSTDPTNDNVGAVSWNFGDGVSVNTWDATHIYSLPDTFPVVLSVSTETLGCTDEYRDTIIVSPAIFTNFIFSNVCLGNEVNFINESIGQGDFEWDFDDGSPFNDETNPSHLYTYADTFNVRLVGISPSGCNDTTVRQVFVFDAPTADFVANSVCANVLATYENMSQPPTMGTLASWFWLFSDGTSASAFSPAKSFPGPGEYEATLIVYSSNLSCSDTVTRPITIFPLPDADFTLSNTCFESPLEPDNVTTGEVASWSWNFGDGSPNSNVQNPSYLYQENGFYNVRLSVISSTGCRDSVMKPVIIYSLPEAQFGSFTVCEDLPTVFYNQSVIGFPDNIIQWRWDFGDGSPPLLAVNPQHVYDDGGIYQVTLAVTSGNGCTDSVTAPVEVWYRPDIDVIITETEGCPPLCIQFFDASTIGDGSIVQWTWNFGDLNTSNSRNAQHCYLEGGMLNSRFYDISLRAVSDNGCADTLILPAHIELYPTPYTDFTWSPDSVSMFDPRVYFEDLSVGADFWDWNFDPMNNGTSNQQDPMYTFLGHGEYEILLTATNNFGCEDTTMRRLEVFSDFRFYIPNAFSPNSDDRNESFFGKGEGIMDYNMQIYDRWGKLIFESNNQLLHWDGSSNGQAVQQGMYTYIFNIRDLNRNRHRYTGEVFLIR